jgi:hypothetical protein
MSWQQISSTNTFPASRNRTKKSFCINIVSGRMSNKIFMKLVVPLASRNLTGMSVTVILNMSLQGISAFESNAQRD